MSQMTYLCLIYLYLYFCFNNNLILMEDISMLYEKTKESLIYTNQNNPDKGIQILKEVQRQLKTLTLSNPQFAQKIQKLEIITLNNLACAYNKKGKYKASLFNLQLANSMEQKIFFKCRKENEVTQPDFIHQIATTHSNLCAVYSQMGHHDKALNQIKKSIQLLQNNGLKQSETLNVFYYNCAIEHQYINSLNEAHKIARKGYNLSQNDPQMLQMYQQCLKRLQEKMKKRQKRIGEYMLKQFNNKQKDNNFRKQNLKPGLSLHYLSQKQKQRGSSQQGSRDSLSKLSKGTMRITEYRRLSTNSQMKDQQRSKKSFILMDYRKKIPSLHDKFYEIPKKDKLVLNKKNKI